MDKTLWQYSPFMYPLSITVTMDEYAALREAVEVLEDMYEQRDAETDKWFHKWLDEAVAHGETIAKLADLTSELSAVDSALLRSQGGLRDAERRIKDLYLVNEKLRETNRTLLAFRGKRFGVVGFSVYDVKTGKYAPFGGSSTATDAARDFNEGKDSTAKYIWRDSPA